MSRSLASFLIFLVALAGVSALGVWWLGADIASLAIDDSRRNQPYYLIHFATLDDPADPYFRLLNDLAREEEGELLWRGALLQLRSGRQADEWQDVHVLGFPRGANLVQMMTRAEFRSLLASQRTLLLGTAGEPVDLAATRYLLVWLLQYREGSEDNAKSAIQNVLRTAAGYSGAVVWNTRADPFGGSDEWDHVVALSFSGPGDAASWLNDPLTVTEQALARKYFPREALLELQSSELAP